ncbi:manganese-binding transcriptional regulator MntR [Arenibaculum pallidiluteum]|uniref:manganese-binding transcriptional regulator MntR n=1 Tax=Arenibaculum pallidiluteum TaxID=2812559 RepID=UPI001A95CC5D|nr:manganese-binding transcriptional regulator MntR [Arenibaculum pallidiluteum]
MRPSTEKRLSMNRQAARRAAAFSRIREAHQTEVAEDYVELIDDLIGAYGEARLVDLAEHMGVSHPTASKIVQRLLREGLVESRPYRAIFLTDAGRRMADEARRRHRIVLEFLRAIGIDEETAEQDAEGIEHHVSEATLEALDRLTRDLARR